MQQSAILGGHATINESCPNSGRRVLPVRSRLPSPSGCSDTGVRTLRLPSRRNALHPGQSRTPFPVRQSFLDRARDLRHVEMARQLVPGRRIPGTSERFQWCLAADPRRQGLRTDRQGLQASAVSGSSLLTSQRHVPPSGLADVLLIPSGPRCRCTEAWTPNDRPAGFVDRTRAPGRHCMLIAGEPRHRRLDDGLKPGLAPRGSRPLGPDGCRNSAFPHATSGVAS